MKMNKILNGISVITQIERLNSLIQKLEINEVSAKMIMLLHSSYFPNPHTPFHSATQIPRIFHDVYVVKTKIVRI